MESVLTLERVAMASTFRFGLALSLFICALAGQADAQRTASPGKYRFSGTIASMPVSGWFEVDVEGTLWLSDATCTAPRASYGTCGVSSVRLRRVSSANVVEVTVELQVRSSRTGGGVRGGPRVERYAGTLSARRA